MSLLSKLAVGAAAVLGAYALKGTKGRARAKPVAGKSAGQRSKKPRAAAAKSATAGRTAERASAHKTTSRKRPDRRAHVKRAAATSR